MEIKEVKPGFFIQKKKWGWKQVRPIKINGKINLRNLWFGDWGNLIGVVLLIIILLGVTIAYKHDLKAYKEVLANKCVRICLNTPFSNITLNYTELHKENEERFIEKNIT
jgi:hypothetical protein